MKIKKSDSWKYNSAGFISIEGYLTHLNPNWRNEDIILIMNAPRNIGKSWGVWAYIEWLWDTFNGEVKICYCRTNGEKIKHAKENFNAKYRGKYYMNDSKIYKQTFDETGKEIMSLRREYGSVVSLNQAENYKSGNFVNHQLFFWDEYNEITGYREQFINFIDILKTVKRMTSPFHVILIGNKVNETNDILHNLEIDFDEITDTEKDYFKTISKNMYYVEIGNETFKFHNPETDLINRLAVFNERTNAYLNEGTYLSTRSDGLYLYKNVEPTKEVFCYFTEGEYIFEFGDFFHKRNLNKDGSVINEDDTDLYFHMINKIPSDNELPIYALDTIGDIREEYAKKLKDTQMLKIAKMLKKNAKRGKIWYCEIDTKHEIEMFISDIIK